MMLATYIKKTKISGYFGSIEVGVQRGAPIPTF